MRTLQQLADDLLAALDAGAGPTMAVPTRPVSPTAPGAAEERAAEAPKFLGARGAESLAGASPSDAAAGLDVAALVDDALGQPKTTTGAGASSPTKRSSKSVGGAKSVAPPPHQLNDKEIDAILESSRAMHGPSMGGDSAAPPPAAGGGEKEDALHERWWALSEAAASQQQGSNIAVAVRVRPPNSRERKLRSAGVVTMHAGTTVKITDPGAADPKKAIVSDFTFDHAFVATTTQRTVFEQVGLPVLRRAFDGYNVTMVCSPLHDTTPCPLTRTTPSSRTARRGRGRLTPCSGRRRTRVSSRFSYPPCSTLSTTK